MYSCDCISGPNDIDKLLTCLLYAHNMVANKWGSSFRTMARYIFHSIMQTSDNIAYLEYIQIVLMLSTAPFATLI